MLPVAISMIENDDDRIFMENLYIEHHKLMYWTAFKVIRHQEGLDDIVNDACVSLIRKISRIRSLDCNILKGYIVSTVKHAAIDYVRKEKHDCCEEENERVLEKAANDAPDTIDTIIYKELIEHLMYSITHLSQRDQSILKMKYLQDLTDEEMAQRLGIKAVTVRSALTRARQRAYRIMKGELNQDE